MGQNQSGGHVSPGLDEIGLDEDLLSRAAELLDDPHARKRTRDEDPAAPPPMFSLPTPSLRRGLSDLAAGDDYTAAVLAAASAYLSTGGKACKPVGDASAGSIGRKALDSPGPSALTITTSPPAPTAVAAAAQRAAAGRAAVARCRRCGSSRRGHQCEAEPAGGAEQRLVPWSCAEDELICSAVHELGFKWSQIAARLGDRTDNAVRNRWHRLEAARKWRAQPQGASRASAEPPGYKCGRCGQPKRGHTCPLAPDAPPAAGPAHAARAQSAESAADDEPPARAHLPIGDCAEGELAQLFAALEAPTQSVPAKGALGGAEGGCDEDALGELVHGILSGHQLEQILSGTEAAADEAAGPGAVRWRTVQGEDGTTWQQPVREESEWAHGEKLSADGAVCF